VAKRSVLLAWLLIVSVIGLGRPLPSPKHLPSFFLIAPGNGLPNPGDPLVIGKVAVAANGLK
jgi:hypothetical protein